MSKMLQVAVVFVVGFAVTRTDAAEVDFTKAVVLTSASIGKQEAKAVQMLVDEVHKRTAIRWPIVQSKPKDTAGVIAISQRKSGPAEGYRLVASDRDNRPAVSIEGNDARGVLFGVGRLLREMAMTKGKV